MGRFVWSADPIRHLRQWEREHDYRHVCLRQVQGVGQSAQWECRVHDLEPCERRGGKVEYVVHGYGRTAAGAADDALTKLMMHVLREASK